MLKDINARRAKNAFNLKLFFVSLFNLKQFFIFIVSTKIENQFQMSFSVDEFSSLTTETENQFQTSFFVDNRIQKINKRRIDIDFQLIDELIYHIHENNDYDIDESRLCISNNC